MRLPYCCLHCQSELVMGICPECSKQPRTTTNGTTNDVPCDASKPPAAMVVGSDPFSLAIKQYFSEPHHGTATSEMLNCASTFWLAGYREGKRDLTAAQLEIDRLKAELLWCVEVLESQRHEMDNEGNISTHVSEGKLEELQAIVANQRKEQKS